MSLLAIVLLVGPYLRAEDGDPAPTDQDEYSGKKIESQDVGYKIIRDRFYNAPKLGDVAPEFKLQEQTTSEVVSLASLRAKKPVVLVFGSFGCDVMRDGIEPVLKAYEGFRDRYEFVMIYTREAHSLEAENSEGQAMFVDPETILGRARAATACRAALKIPFRILVDSMDDRVATRWAGWPVRIFVVERDGTVVYSGRPGPWGFSPGGGFKPSLADQLRPHADRFSQESLEAFLSAYKPQP